MCVCFSASVRLPLLLVLYHMSRERVLRAKHERNAPIPVPVRCCMCVRREKLGIRMSPWSKGFACTIHCSMNCNFTFVATPQCVNGRWDADGYLNSHRDFGGEACIVMAGILLGHWLYLLITTWMDVCEGAEKWVVFSAEDSTDGRRVSIWFEEEEKNKNNNHFVVEYVVFAW